MGAVDPAMGAGEKMAGIDFSAQNSSLSTLSAGYFKGLMGSP